MAIKNGGRGMQGRKKGGEKRTEKMEKKGRRRRGREFQEAEKRI